MDYPAIFENIWEEQEALCRPAVYIKTKRGYLWQELQMLQL